MLRTYALCAIAIIKYDIKNTKPFCFVCWYDKLSHSTKHKTSFVTETSILSRPYRPIVNGRHLANDRFKCIFVNEMFCILINKLLIVVPKGPIDNSQALD